MGKKTIYLSESQVDGVVGLKGYLRQSSDNTIPPYSATETTTGEDNVNDEPVIADKLAYSLSTSGLGNRRSGLYCSKNNKKKVFEGSNQDFDKKTYKTTDELHSALLGSKTTNSRYKDSKGYKTICNLTDNRNVTTSEMYRLKNRLENLNAEDVEYKILCGDILLPWINKTIGREQDISKRHKEVKTEMGFENQYQKSGGTKESGNGKAHSATKNNNIISINYENN